VLCDAMTTPESSFLGAGTWMFVQLICARRAPIQEQKWSNDCCH
jgi:hypothetical protein